MRSEKREIMQKLGIIKNQDEMRYYYNTSEKNINSSIEFIKDNNLRMRKVDSYLYLVYNEKIEMSFDFNNEIKRRFKIEVRIEGRLLNYIVVKRQLKKNIDILHSFLKKNAGEGYIN